MASNNRPPVKYVYELPYFERRELCRILDHNDKWEELGGQYMKFEVMTIQYLRQLIMRGRSPTDELLTLWGHQNHTVLELFVLLSRMQHYQSMMTLKEFVDPQYHRLIYEGEENLTRIFRNSNTTASNTHSSPPSPVKPCNMNASHNSSQHPSSSAAGGGCQNPPLYPVLSQPQSCKSMEVGTHNLNNPEPVSPQNQEKSGIIHKPSPAVDDSEGKILNTARPPLLGIPASNEENANVTSVSPVTISPAGIQGPPEEKENNVPTPDSQKRSFRSDVPEASSVAESHSSVRHILYKELVVATNGWDKATILGRGGFGTVYKGNWKNTLVAIKRIELRGGEASSNQAQLEQSLREMKYLNEYRHDNILPLYGYSLDGEEPCLLYQFIQNGSLEDRLLCRNGTAPLSWVQRQNIARGTARGLQFLHTIGDKPLIHGDIKSANILLDQNFEARIGDFGLAREGPNNQYTHIKVSRVHGTRPYLPDEFLRSKQISTKVDTYSFGIVLFELATGLRAYDDSRPRKFLKDLVEFYEEEGRDLRLIDRKASFDGTLSAEWMGMDVAGGCPSPEPINSIFSDLLRLGKLCVKRKPAERPEMVLVHQELEAMTARREMEIRAQSLLRKNNLTPTNPYEKQLLHDQWLRMSPQPIPLSLQKVPLGLRLSPNPGGSMFPSPGNGSSTSFNMPSPIMNFHNNQPLYPKNPMDPAFQHLHWPSPVVAPIALLAPRIPSVQVQPPSPVPPEESHQLHQGAHNGYDGGSKSPTPGQQSSMSIQYSDEFLPATIPGQGDSSSEQNAGPEPQNNNSEGNAGACSGLVDSAQLLPLISKLGITHGNEVCSENSTATAANSRQDLQIQSERQSSNSQHMISARGKSILLFGED